MKDSFKIGLLIIIVLSIDCKVLSQDSDTSWVKRYEKITKKVRDNEKSIPGLSSIISNSVSGVQVAEFLRGVAISSGLNISIDPKLSFQIINNFDNTKVSDVLLFICDQYKLDLDFIGNIIVIRQQEKLALPNRCEVLFDSTSNLISLDIDDIELGTLTKRIIDATGFNIIPGNGLNSQKISVYVQRMNISSALEKIAYSNNLIIKKSDDGSFLYEKVPVEKVDISGTRVGSNVMTRTDKETGFKLSVIVLANDSLTLFAEKAPVSEVIKELSNKAGHNYLLASIPKAEVTLHLTGVKYETALKTILAGTDHIFREENGIYSIGSKDSPGLMNQVIIQLQYRSVDSVLYLIPKDLVGDIDAKIFREQNSIMLSGPKDRLSEAENYIRQIDKLVPVVSIEVMIIDYNSSQTISTGITAGVSNDEIQPSSGNVFPSVNMNLNSQSINDLINRFNGYGWAKIGRVTPRFYMQIKALENQGVLNIRSTPVLSTLNGHQTKLSIGNTEYYLEEQFNIIGTQNPQSTKIETYKPIEAELAVTITPLVSGDDQITLEIEVTQSDFTERISKTAPPGKVSRTFKSQIRVRNEEMILLGGLEEVRNSRTSSGTPLLARIPILKWIFSSKSDEKSKSKLNIFIKPTIIS